MSWFEVVARRPRRWRGRPGAAESIRQRHVHQRATGRGATYQCQMPDNQALTQPLQPAVHGVGPDSDHSTQALSPSAWLQKWAALRRAWSTARATTPAFVEA